MGARVMIDGGPGSEPAGRLDAWLVTDVRSELIAQLRRLARSRELDRRLVFAHVGRPTLRAIDRGERPPFGELGRDGQIFRLPIR